MLNISSRGHANQVKQQEYLGDLVSKSLPPSVLEP